MKVHEAMAAVMNDVPVVAKSDKNQAQGWNFRGVDAVVNALGPAMRRHGVVLVPEVLSHHAELLDTGRGKSMRSVVVTVRYTFTGPEGDTLVAASVGEAFDSGDKATAKAMSVALRTCLLQTFMLPTDDPDPDHEVYEVAAPAKTPPKPKRGTGSVLAFPADAPDRWPDRLTPAEAKKAILHALDGDKEAARDLWDQVGGDNATLTAEEVRGWCEG
jgi:hypothetical protein